MGFTGRAITCLFSSTSSQRPKKRLQSYHYTLVTFTLRNVVLGKSSSLQSEPGDFNGAAWCCSNRNNISTIDEAFADCTLPTPPGRETTELGGARPEE